MKTEEIILQLEKLAPLSIQEHWDNSGIQIKSHNREVSNILLTLDILEDSVEFAIKNGCNLIISHHPIFFKNFKNISIDTVEGKLISKIIKNEINVVSFHTNIDSAQNGLADFFAKKLSLTEISPLINKNLKKYKIVTFIPENYLESFISLLLNNNLSVIGNYKACAFYCNGTGTFYPEEDALPYCGDTGKLNKINEYRIEIVSNEIEINYVINLIKQHHPYEEPLIDIYDINYLNLSENVGFGRIGILPEPVEFEEFVKKIKKLFNIEFLKITNNVKKKIKKVAVCPGSGGSLIKNALIKGADIYITGDVKYHEALEAKQNGLIIIDMGHFETEIIFTLLLKDYIKNYLKIPVIIYNQKQLFKYI